MAANDTPPTPLPYSNTYNRKTAVCLALSDVISVAVSRGCIQVPKYGVAPVGFFPDLDIVTAFVVIIEGERGYSLGFDRAGEQWVLVEQFEDVDDFAGVTDRLREWMGDDWDDVV